ncbi:hypothetical protein EDC94DRAFT_625875 [Helicostylum pulchrum]|nr:hypothetical protein EDC94DRAFT_625875 [Helicostylum pulchrum]
MLEMSYYFFYCEMQFIYLGIFVLLAMTCIYHIYYWNPSIYKIRTQYLISVLTSNLLNKSLYYPLYLTLIDLMQ